MKFKIAALFAAATLIAVSSAEEVSGAPYDVEQEFTQGGTTNEVKASGELPPPARRPARPAIAEDESEMTNDESNPTEPPAPKEAEEEGEGGGGEARRARDIIFNTDVDYSITYIYNDDPKSTSNTNGNIKAEIFSTNFTSNSTVGPTGDYEEVAATLAAIDHLIAEIQSTDYNMPLTDEEFEFLYEIFIGPIPEDDTELIDDNAQDDLFPLTEAEIDNDESASADVDADADADQDGDVDVDQDNDMDAQSSDVDEGLDQETGEDEGVDQEAGEDDEQEEENENEEEDENENEEEDENEEDDDEDED